jgi:hypothetical protein
LLATGLIVIANPLELSSHLSRIILQLLKAKIFLELNREMAERV